jgi:methionyl-tRNA formyltransferase
MLESRSPLLKATLGPARLMSIIFVGTPAFAVPSLRRLVANGHEISAVLTQPDRPVGRHKKPQPPPLKVAAEELGLPVVQPQTLRDPTVVADLRAKYPETIVVVAYGQILRPDVLEIPARGVLNVHPSLLPRWRGASPIPAAILAGDNETGVTIMLMDAGMDSGPILSQRAVTINDDDVTASLSDHLSETGAELLAETLPRWLAGEIEPRPQDDSRATTCPLIRKEHGSIDWNLRATDIWRRVRAYNPWPGAYTELDGDLLHIWRAWPIEHVTNDRPGTVIELDETWHANLPGGYSKGGFAVATGDGVLVPTEVQRAGRRALSAAEFMRGMPKLIGWRLSDLT